MEKVVFEVVECEEGFYLVGEEGFYLPSLDDVIAAIDFYCEGEGIAEFEIKVVA